MTVKIRPCLEAAHYTKDSWWARTIYNTFGLASPKRMIFRFPDNTFTCCRELAETLRLEGSAIILDDNEVARGD